MTIPEIGGALVILIFAVVVTPKVTVTFWGVDENPEALAWTEYVPAVETDT